VKETVARIAQQMRDLTPDPHLLRNAGYDLQMRVDKSLLLLFFKKEGLLLS